MSNFKKNLLACTYASVMAVGLMGCMDKYDSSENEGNYERTTTTVNDAGTKTTSTTKQDVDVDSNGNVNKKVTQKTTTDPKGLMNKSTSKRTYEEEQSTR